MFDDKCWYSGAKGAPQIGLCIEGEYVKDFVEETMKRDWLSEQSELCRTKRDVRQTGEEGKWSISSLLCDSGSLKYLEYRAVGGSSFGQG